MFYNGVDNCEKQNETFKLFLKNKTPSEEISQILVI